MDSAGASTDAMTRSAESDHGIKKLVGPLVEAEVEADKVAQELYPEAVDNK
jgi:hypothetical protein